jgi:peptidyl-prolyl cis-trans isomerase SurA
MRLAAFLVLVSLAPAEIIDRIAVTVDNRVITESEILRQIRITAFLNNQSVDLSGANKRAMADRLVEQVLIRRELEMTRYARPDAASSTSYQQLKQRFRGDDDYKQTLARYEISDADIKEALDWQAELLDFIDLRFRPGIQIGETEIREYYDQLAAQNPGKVAPFPDAKEEIEKVLTSQRVDNAVDRWLGQARTQNRIRYVQEVFQ